MNILNKIFILISTVSVIFILSVVFHKIWITAQRTALHSCIYSVSSDIVEYSNEIGDFAQNAENWYVLTDSEAKAVLSNEYIKFEDCSSSTSKPQDIKEKILKIAVRKDGESGFRLMAWSKGFDDISGTEDDIVSPFGEEVPE